MSDETLAAVSGELTSLATTLRSKGFARPTGFGEHPALLVVDFARAFTDPASPLGGDFSAEVAVAARLVEAAHRAGAPVIFSTVAFQPSLVDAGIWTEKQAGNELLVQGSKWVELDDRLPIGERDSMLVKRQASCFFGTDLVSRLVAERCDGLVIAGCTTSGCVRASAVDACSLSLRTVVVADAVGDRSPISHLASLFDLEMKYADVVTSDVAIDRFAAVTG